MLSLTVGRFFSLPTHNGPTVFIFQKQYPMAETGSYGRRSKSDPTMGSEESGINNPDIEVDDDIATQPDDDVNSVGSTPGTLSRNPSFSNSSSYQEDWEAFPPLDKLSVFDLLDNFSLSQRLEKWHQTINAQKEKVKRQRERLKSTSSNAKDRVVGEWRRHVPTAEEQLDKYRLRMTNGVERLAKQWTNTTTVTAREKISFIAGVVNVFVSGYLIGAFPEYFHIWYTIQLAFFMPVRYFRYHKKGYHYFLADLCYFVNLLAVLSIWVFPNSRRLFISTYCLAFGNNAVAIPLWRNSMVFHSTDKVVSVFIHIMPPAALHCLTHLTSVETLKERFPAIYDIKFSDPKSPEHYSLGDMVIWATIPYAIWQLVYHCFITVRRRDKIAAGRPTSFTWLRKSWGKTWLGKIVLSLPEQLQVPAYMLIQYMYAILAMVPCPIWFWSKQGSSLFLFVVFVWSVYNGSTFYIDVFGKRFQKELEQLKKDVARWQASPEGIISPGLAPASAPATTTHGRNQLAELDKASLDRIPPLDSMTAATGMEDDKEKVKKANNRTSDSEIRERK